MLKYTVRPSKETALKDFPIKNFFVSPDLSFISGTTDYNTGLVDGEEVIIKSPYLIGNEVNTVNVEDVKIQGRVGVKLTLPVSSITKTIRFDIFSDEDGCYYYEHNKKQRMDSCDEHEGDFFFKTITQKYVEYRGDISYFYEGNEISGYLIDHKFYKALSRDESIEIETYVPIENGLLTIGDYVYETEFKVEGEKPELKLNKYKTPLNGNQLVGLLNGYSCTTMSDTDGSVFIKDYQPSKWERVSKFKIVKHENPRLEPDDVKYGGYRHYVTYQDENYYLNETYIDGDYMGYGVMINNNFYPEISGYVNGEVYEAHKDLGAISSTVYLAETDEILEVVDSLVSFTDGGKFILFIDSSDNTDVTPGNFIIAESNGPIRIFKTVEEDADRKQFVMYQGKRYDVKEHLCDNVILNDVKFPLTYLNDSLTSASTVVNGETLYFNISGGKAVLSNKIYYKENRSTPNTIFVNYGINENGYNVEENSGITVNDINYPVIVDNTETDEGSGLSYYVEFEDIVTETFEITEINGSSTYLCYPVVDETLFDDYEIDYQQREICDIVVNNWKQFNFVVRKDTFGKNPFTPENGLVESMKSEKPYTMSDAFLLENKISILRMENYLSFKFPLVNKIATNIMREDIIKSDFVDSIKNQAINKVIDMEKDVYFPVYKKKVDEEDDMPFHPIRRLRFNLHFRTRDLDNWKIIEDDREFKGDDTPNSRMCNWFVTDYKYYKNDIGTGNKYLHNSSDLLGFLNFTTSEIKYQATKLGKSFLRLSFYSTNNPKTQVLLATSTIFFDEHSAYKKFLDTHRNSDLIYVNTKLFEDSKYDNLKNYADDVKNQTDKIQISGKSISNFSEVLDDNYLNDGFRLSSRFIVDDKYNTNTSSEGYYIYMFKEYSKKLHEATIYMKVEFNHAGIGKTIQFMYPRRIGSDDEVGEPLYMSNPEHLKILKNGFKIEDIYKQTHIPLRVIYDEKDNKYVYYLPEKLRQNNFLNVDDEIMEFNLFETKFANESIVEYNEDNQY